MPFPDVPSGPPCSPWSDLAAAFSTTCGGGRPASDASFRLPVSCRQACRCRNTRTRAPTRPSRREVTQARSAFPRQMPFASADFHRVARSPPPFPRFCHRRAGFRRPFVLLPLARGELDPPAAFAVTVKARRLLSTSAIDTIREHDHATHRTPSTLTAVARGPGSSRAHPCG